MVLQPQGGRRVARRFRAHELHAINTSSLTTRQKCAHHEEDGSRGLNERAYRRPRVERGGILLRDGPGPMPGVPPGGPRMPAGPGGGEVGA